MYIDICTVSIKWLESHVLFQDGHSERSEHVYSAFGSENVSLLPPTALVVNVKPVFVG